jgi:hypothetical protein
MELWEKQHAYISRRFVCSGLLTMSIHEQVVLSALIHDVRLPGLLPVAVALLWPVVLRLVALLPALLPAL